MEKHRCKLCFKSFVNGRALGGHMRSHMMNLYVPPKPEQQQQHNDEDEDDRLGEESESTPSSSSSSDEEEDENEEKGLLCYGLRENPKKSVRLVDPEFSFAGSVVLQDRESETESSKNPTRRRSKRIRRSIIPDPDRHHCQPETKKLKSGQPGKLESPAEPEPVSSISDTSPEEDVAYCLMMLSRDKWVLRDEEDEDDQTEESDEFKYRNSNNKGRTRGKYRCETCDRVFRSYQALGGHRASHKKSRAHNNGGSISIRERPLEVAEEKVHECPVCYRVFASGQALGGHKRSHVIGSSSATTTVLPPKPVPLKLGSESLIDLNLPAPIDDDDISQIELSAVSDAEFVNTHQGMNV